MSRDFSTVVDDVARDTKGTRSPGLHFDPKRFISLRTPAILVIAAVLGVPFAICGWIMTPVEFTATAQIQYRSSASGVSGPSYSATDYMKFVLTEVNKLSGDNVLTKVLQQPNIQALPSIRAEADKLTFLKGRISARELNKSELVNVNCRMKSRQEALEVLRAVTTVYNEQAQLEAEYVGSQKVNALNEQIEKLEYDLEQRRRSIETLVGALGASGDGVHPQDSMEAQQYRESMLLSEDGLKSAKKAVVDVEEQIARLAAVQASHKENPAASIFDFPVETMVNSDPRVSTLQSDIVRLEGMVEIMRETHKEGHPELKAQIRNLDTMRRNLAKQEIAARTDALKTLEGEFRQLLEAAHRNVTDAEATLASNQERYDNFIETELSALTRTSEERAKLEKLKEEAAADRVSIENWRAQVRNLQLEERGLPRVSIVTPPYAPLTQGITKKLMMAAMGLLAAAGIGVAYGVLRELLDGQIRTQQDISRISSLPVLASIPHFGEDAMLSETDTSLLMAQHPNSIIADEYRRILARILFPEDNAAEISSLMVVSASCGDGKTSVACNLAVALEHANRRVLLIDLSSQRPQVESTFGLHPGPGLSELLKSDEAREDLIRRTAFENLGVIGPGRDPAALSGRLASREMMDFMEWADEHFDHIIIDTPPLLLMSDAKLIAPAIDGVLFVAGVGKSSLGMVSRSLRDLELLRANTIGVVLNGIRSLRGGYLKKNQKLFYAYAGERAGSRAVHAMPEINVLDEDIPETVETEVVLLPVEKHRD